MRMICMPRASRSRIRTGSSAASEGIVTMMRVLCSSGTGPRVAAECRASVAVPLIMLTEAGMGCSAGASPLIMESNSLTMSREAIAWASIRSSELRPRRAKSDCRPRISLARTARCTSCQSSARCHATLQDLLFLAFIRIAGQDHASRNMRSAADLHLGNFVPRI